MLHQLDNLLRQLLTDQIPGLTEVRVGFQPPDEAWRHAVAGMQGNALNIYLVDMRENRKLRSNERVRGFEQGQYVDEPAPARVDCHYLITAWSPAQVTPQVETTLDEHALLSQAVAALMRSAPLVPTRVYPKNAAPLQGWPERFRNADLPTAVLPVEGFPKYAEFWGTMGAGSRWKPGIYLVVTIPVALLSEIAGPPVTTTITEYGLGDSQAPGEVWIQIGGTVINPAGAVVEDAWLALETQAGERLHVTSTDDEGRFRFEKLRAGTYRLHARATGFKPVLREVEIPSPSGEYDLRLP